METPRSPFVWYDLMTPSTSDAGAFYASVAGWGAVDWSVPGQETPPYTMFTVGEATIGGMMASPEGTPPHWLVYIGTPDVEATCAAVEAHGGAVLAPPQDIPTIGRFAICRDPQGAVFATFQPDPSPDSAPPEEPLSIWHELATTDVSAGLAFYRDVFGWADTGAHDMGPEFGMYQMFGAGADPVGGMYHIMDGMEMPPSWTPYMPVADLDGAVTRVRDGGGQIMQEPMEVPGGDRVAMCVDPHGAMFGLYERAAG